MDARKVVVTLVCATADAEALDDVVDGLSASGREVGLVLGIDEQPRRVAEALERMGPAGLLVVCTGPRLDSANMRKIEGMFSARRGPNHALIRVDVGLPTGEMIAAIQRALDAFVANQGRVRRESTSDPKREKIVGVPKSLALPVVRLEAGEELDGDTRRVQLPDNPKAAELSRRRRVARERERERERITQSHRVLDEDLLPPRPEPTADEAGSEWVMIAVVIGAGILAVIGALMFSGVV